MESKWYLFSGQTLENTKISDRAHALHITKSGWDGITKHLDRKKLLQETVDKETAIRKYLDEGSKNMTKSWENSLENVRRRKKEERLKLMEQKHEERKQKFLQLRKEQEELRAQYMAKVKKQIFMTTGHARDLTSALVTSEVLFERQKQQEFMEKIKQREKEVDLTYLKIQQEKSEKEDKEDEEKRKKSRKKQNQHFGELKKVIEEKAVEEKALKEKTTASEAQDNREAFDEIEQLERLIKADKQRKKKELFEERKKYFQKQKDQEQQRIKEEKELDEVIEIYKDSKHRIDCMRKQREQEIRDAVVKRREKVAAMVMAEHLDRSEAEEKAIKAAVAEREASEIEKIKAKQEHDDKIKRERLKDREETLKKASGQQKKEEELKKWELLNRYKTDENMKRYEETKRRAAWQEIIKYRQELCEQMEEHRLEQLREKEIDDAMAKTCVAEEDGKFFEYADEVLQLAKRKGRTTVPIERVIARYLKDMNINLDANAIRVKISPELKKLMKPAGPKLCRCNCPGIP